MKRSLCIVLVAILSISIIGCASAKKVAETVKPKPTKAGAESFEAKWNSFYDTGKYAEQYSLLVPAQQKLISKDTYVKSCQDAVAQANGQKSKVTINSVELKGNTAIVAITVNYPLGTYTANDEIIFIDGKWYQSLEAGSLIHFGVSPSKIESIKKGAIGQQITIPAYSIIIANPRSDKTATGSYGSRETAQGKFIMVDASMTNTGKQPFRPSSSSEFKLSDSEGRVFSPSNKYTVFEPFGEIGPSMSETKTIGFDVPDTASGFIFLVGQTQDMYSVVLGF